MVVSTTCCSNEFDAWLLIVGVVVVDVVGVVEVDVVLVVVVEVVEVVELVLEVPMNY